MGDEKICPLFAIARQYTRLSSMGTTTCSKEQCAWWNPETNCCSIKAAADALRKIARGK